MATTTLALLITAPPYAGREARAELDVALAAAAMDCELEIYWFGDALLQLAAHRHRADALLPPGLKGWAALPEMGEAQSFAEAAAWSRCRDLGLHLSLSLELLGEQEFKQRWRSCQHVMVI